MNDQVRAHECPPIVRESCAPWPPRHCERCDACEADVKFLYRTTGEGGTYRERHPRLMCSTCYEACRPPRQLGLGW